MPFSLRDGCLLTAAPTILNDNSFKRSIVLVTEHSNESSVGFILNKPSSFIITDLIPEIKCNFKVYSGGPVENDSLYFIHKAPHLIPNSVEISDGIYWGGNFESIKDLLITKRLECSDIRFFLGYSGWGEGQLADEIEENSWFISTNDYQNILAIDHTSLWKNEILLQEDEYKIWANAPIDIGLN